MLMMMSTRRDGLGHFQREQTGIETGDPSVKNWSSLENESDVSRKSATTNTTKSRDFPMTRH